MSTTSDLQFLNRPVIFMLPGPAGRAPWAMMRLRSSASAGHRALHPTDLATRSRVARATHPWLRLPYFWCCGPRWRSVGAPGRGSWSWITTGMPRSAGVVSLGRARSFGEYRLGGHSMVTREQAALRKRPGRGRRSQIRSSLIAVRARGTISSRIRQALARPRPPAPPVTSAVRLTVRPFLPSLHGRRGRAGPSSGTAAEDAKRFAPPAVRHPARCRHGVQATDLPQARRRDGARHRRPRAAAPARRRRPMRSG